MNRILTSLSLILCLSACGADGSAQGGGAASRSATPSFADTEAAMDPCAAVAEQQPQLELRVTALRALADAGEVCAQYGIGTLYVFGYETIDPDPALAQRYLQLAATQGHSAAQRELDRYFTR